MIRLGLDIGSIAAKGVLLDGSKVYQAIIPTGWSPRDASETLINMLLQQSNRQKTEIEEIIGTGYGRISIDCAQKTVTEIACHARGVAAMNPEVRTIIDIGGQDSKVIRIDKAGKVQDFAMNDKCAAGTGRFLTVMANAMGMDISEWGDKEDVSLIVPINSMCTVFAESEIINLIARGISKEGIIAGLHQSIARRVAAMVKRMGVEKGIAFTGGVALNAGVKRALEEELQAELIIPANCQYTGALGAALLNYNV